GAFAGVCGDGVIRLFAPALERYKDIIDPSRVTTYHFLASGIVLFNIPAFFRRRALPKEVEDAFEAIRRSKAEMSPLQVRMQYLALCSDVIARTNPRPKAGSR